MQSGQRLYVYAARASSGDNDDDDELELGSWLEFLTDFGRLSGARQVSLGQAVVCCSSDESWPWWSWRL